jgi:ribonucleoside-triphosphate reductase
MALGNKLVQEVQRMDKYAKWVPELSRRETWFESCDRTVGFFRGELHKQGKYLSEDTWDELFAAMLDYEVLPSMRAVQMAGPAAARDHTCLYNCAYLPLNSPVALKELLYILMCGTGVGYSVEKENIAAWPEVRGSKIYPLRSAPQVIEDSSEGWAEAFYRAINLSLDGIEPEFDYSNIRPKGTWLKTKGGRASGPEPLRRLLEHTWLIISARQGSRLTSFDIHRLACIAGSIVDVGGVRRAALIALFSPEDTVMRDCKTGDWYGQYPELAKANNSMSAAYGDIAGVFTTLSTSGYGEPGLFNRYSNHARAHGVLYGTNPCGEILLEPNQFCNLSIAVAREHDDSFRLKQKVRLATIWGTIQSCMTNFPHLRSEWKFNCERERLLGVDITGTQDCELLNHRSPSWHIAGVLEMLRNTAHATNREFAAKLGINQSAAITCNKPSGNSSQLVDCSSGIHARWAPYYRRRLTIEPNSPLGLRLKEKGIPYVETSSAWLFAFPIKSPASAVVRGDMNGMNQLAYWLLWQRHWCDHNASSTIYIEPHLWSKAQEWVSQFWPEIGGLSFLPKDNNSYENAPYEEITKEEYDTELARLPASLDLGTIIEVVDNSTLGQDAACAGGFCEF